MQRRYLVFFLIWVIAGCASSFAEKHFFKSVDQQGYTINYYRLKVNGSTFLSSSRYLSGYFDERAVDAYFNQITQPKEATFKDTGKR